MSLISIEGMEFFAYHGCFKEEQIIKNANGVTPKRGNVSDSTFSLDRISDMDTKEIYANLNNLTK